VCIYISSLSSRYTLLIVELKLLKLGPFSILVYIILSNRINVFTIPRTILSYIILSLVSYKLSILYIS